jgi:hypothetical protein
MNFQDLTLSNIPVIKVWSVDKRYGISFSFEIIIPICCYDLAQEGDLSDISMEAGCSIMKHGEAVNVAHPIIE